MAQSDQHTDAVVRERVTPKNQEPELYRVLLLNDDYSTMDFVIHVLESVFTKSPAEAYRIMLAVHTQGQGLAGIYPWEVAETKVDALVTLARESGHPLQATIEDA